MVGAGGHARVCLEMLLDGGHEVIGTLSGDGRGIGGLPIPVLGLDVDFEQVWATHQPGRVFVAIGDNTARAAVTRACEAVGSVLASAVSAHAVVSRWAVVEPGAAVMPGAVVNAAARIGRGAVINTNASVDHDCVSGEFAHVAPGSVLCGSVRVGDGTLIGAGATVAPNITIGARVIVGAGAVVLSDVPDGAVVAGVPARARGIGAS